MNVFNIISLFGGLSLFLYGMRIMGDGLKRGSSGTLKKAMEKVTNNPFVGFFLGLIITCIIQSSTATIVLTSGLVGAGILSLHQSIGIIIGANVGTTITGQIIRLLDVNAEAASWINIFKPSTLAPIAAIIGILLIMAFKFHNSDTIGNIAMGFGILFTGLLTMTAAVSPLSESEAFARIFIGLADRPVLGFLVGAGAAFAIQSSSATVGILQALSITGQLTFGSIYAIIIGIYLGDCVTTAIVCSIGAKADAKRTGIVHILFNLCEIVLVILGVAIFKRTDYLSALWNKALSSGGIANVNTTFKLGSAILLLPVCGLLEKASRKIIKDDPEQNKQLRLELETLDKAFFSSPALALSSAQKVISSMATRACNGASNAMATLMKYDGKSADEINAGESDIDELADGVSDYLVHLSSHVDEDNGGDKLNYYIKCVSEFERIGDYAVNIVESAQELKEKDAEFSATAKEELMLLQEILNEIMGYACTALNNEDVEAARHIEPIEEVVDDLVANLRSNHIRRLREGKCTVDAGFTFLDVLVNIERIADQCSNIGVFTIGLRDEKIAVMQHDYIRSLHQGEDRQYTEEYNANRKRFFDRLGEIEASAD